MDAKLMCALPAAYNPAEKPVIARYERFVAKRATFLLVSPCGWMNKLSDESIDTTVNISEVQLISTDRKKSYHGL